MTTSADTIFDELLSTAESDSLCSRNHNNELLGIDCYQQLSLLSHTQLSRLEEAWQRKRLRAQKEKISSQFMIVQMTLLMLIAVICAWFIGGIVGLITSLVGIFGLFIVIDSKRVSTAKQNLLDADAIYDAIKARLQSSPY
jgi:hypothetical protein